RKARCLGAAAAALTLFAMALPASAQSFRAQCPPGTLTHPAIIENDPNVQVGDRSKYSTVTQLGRTDGLLNPTPAMANPHIKCQQIAGGDGYATMGDGTQTYMFSFGPLSGLADIVQGKAATETATVYNQNNLDASGNVLDVVKIGAPYPGYTFN